METIQNYLEAMFANMPNTEEVLRAKNELFQMMEDKYNELIAEGHSDNEAVGTVISEFGNLEEISKDLGISTEVKEADAINKRKITLDEGKDYVKRQASLALWIALGVFFCIFSIVPVLGFSAFDGMNGNAMDIVAMFILIAMGVFCFVYSGLINHKWDFLHEESCYIDMNTVKWLQEQKEQYRTTAAMQKAMGIILCILSLIPILVSGKKNVSFPFIVTNAEEIGVALMFIFIAVGVFLIIYSTMCFESYDKLLYLNDETTVSGNYKKQLRGKKGIYYKNKTLNSIMSLYWTTITCIYLCWSFLTFDWHITWIVWVVGALVQMIIETIYQVKGNGVD